MRGCRLEETTMRLATRGNQSSAAARRLVALALAPAVDRRAARSTSAEAAAASKPGKKAIRIVTLDPGHFHAALPHRESYPDVDRRVHVYAPLGTTCRSHQAHRAVQHRAPTTPPPGGWRCTPGPTSSSGSRRRRRATWWSSRAATGARSTTSRPRSAPGYHALVDKPWVLRSEDLPKLKATLDLAEKKGRIAYDMMTERFEITTHPAEGAGQRSGGVRQGRCRARPTSPASTWRACTT